MKKIVVVGAGGFGREVEWLIEEINQHNNQWSFEGFVDDKLSPGTISGKSKVIGDIEWLKSQNLNVVVAVGDPLSKKKIVNRLKDSNNSFPILIHPNVRLSDSVRIGQGSIICSGCILTTDISVGDHVILNLDSTVGHDATIGDYSTILPSVNISGFVKINASVSVGTGTQVIQGLEIGEETIIGAGAVVTKNIPSKVVAVGMPARAIKERG